MFEENIVRAKNLVKRFEDFTAVKGIDLYVKKGECFGLLGPNGAGKTSIVKMIHGFSPVSAGQLEVFGQDVSRHARDIKARIGIVPQEDNLDPDISVQDNLLVYAGYFLINKEVAKERAEEILEFMDLNSKAGEVVEHLSGGLKRRLTLGRALINKPEFIILDEPTTGLDPYARHLVWQRLRRLKEAGTTMLLTTHYLEEASQLCDRLVILHQGQVLEQGTPQELIDRHVGKEALELGLIGDREQLLAGVEELVKGIHSMGDELLLYTDHGQALSELVSQCAAKLGISITYRRIRPANLEDVFLKLTGESLRESFGDGGEE